MKKYLCSFIKFLTPVTTFLMAHPFSEEIESAREALLTWCYFSNESFWHVEVMIIYCWIHHADVCESSYSLDSLLLYYIFSDV